MKIGIDVGNGYTKFNGEKFASRVKVGEKIQFGKQKKDIHSVKYDGVNYIVGEGNIFTGDDRYFTKEYTLCLLTAIALSAGNEDFIEASICVGLPEGKHRSVSDKLQKFIKEIGQKQIVVNKKEYTVRIKECIVFIEGALPVITGEENNVIVIDNGAGTINVTQWEDLSILKSATYNESMFKMYDDICAYINSEKGGSFMPIDMEKYLNKKTLMINQEEKDITDIRPIIQSHISLIASYIRNAFDVKVAQKIYLIGGGGADTINYWKDEFKIELVKDNQLINQMVYDAVANEEFGDNE